MNAYDEEAFRQHEGKVQHRASCQGGKGGREDPLTPRLLGRKRLEGDRVARDGGEVVVPQPGDALLAALEADEVVALGRAGHALLAVRVVVPVDPAGADDEDVARLELDILFFCDGFDVGDLDAGALSGRVRDVVLLGPGVVVDQDATANESAALGPNCGVGDGVGQLKSVIWLAKQGHERDAYSECRYLVT